MKITHRLTDRYTDPVPEECFVEYEILADGKPTGYSLKRVGTDLAELVDPDGNEEYLGTSDLRVAIPQARNTVARRLG